ncbi:zinc knuckle-domain-containing protein [Podospora fimiseda]|uniref:Zinc knuckle-domain-containing protein n=1 Tax=Podospora fimiseda TaxID=252190 RepID=A0AAN7GSG7_9PEZI|nr:zinc knuckle-domain-containing protein [Podospora fimiseda]
MYRRAGPSHKAPANIQCQKCLQRGHYSYECKASTQERPYIPRPSRTQQLFNPKLLPKLTNAVPEELQTKKGVADQELAKREAERVRKQTLDDDDDEEDNGAMKDASSPKRHRESSYDSVSSTSTRSSRSRSPPRRSPSPRPERRRGRERDGPRRRSPSPRRSQSPPRIHSPPSLRDRDYGSKARQSYSRSRSRSKSRSPSRSLLRREERRDARGREYHDRVQLPIHRQQNQHPPRERSLSPFSKRLALTQAMNMGDR